MHTTANAAINRKLLAIAVKTLKASPKKKKSLSRITLYWVITAFLDLVLLKSFFKSIRKYSY
jgi:hypothetical protein